MEQRTMEFYRKQPSILRYRLKAANDRDPELLAIALAITNKKNVVLAPKYKDKVHIHGQIGNPPISNRKIRCCDWVETSPIESIFFEKVYMKDYVDLHCYVKTQNSIYRLYDCEKNRLTWMHFLLQDIEERDLSFGDFIEYFSDINTNYREIEITD